MKVNFFITIWLIFVAIVVIAQNTPVALHKDASESQSIQVDRLESNTEDTELKKSEEEQPLIKKRKLKKFLKKNRATYFDWEEFGIIFFAILGFLVILAGLISFFWFATLGWWVLLTALGGIVLGCLIMSIGVAISGNDIAILGPFFVFIIAMFGWLIGLLTISIISWVT